DQRRRDMIGADIQAEERPAERSLDDLFEKLSQGETSRRARRAIERQALQEIRRMPTDRERVGAAAELLSLAGGQAVLVRPVRHVRTESVRAREGLPRECAKKGCSAGDWRRAGANRQLYPGNARLYISVLVRQRWRGKRLFRNFRDSYYRRD
ncbi:MAG: hypothetical protein WB992_08775, partial [Bryobacteraceae bacterium]